MVHERGEAERPVARTRGLRAHFALRGRGRLPGRDSEMRGIKKVVSHVTNRLRKNETLDGGRNCRAPLVQPSSTTHRHVIRHSRPSKSLRR